MDLQNLPEGTPVWATVIALVITLYGMLSEKAGKIAGPLGSLSRWWNSRAVRKVQQRQELDDEITELVDKQVDRRMGEMRRDITSLRQQVEQLRETERNQHDYILWVTDVLRRVEIWAADKGYVLPPPPFQTYSEWLETRTRTPPEA